jgi:hypothetical protein
MVSLLVSPDPPIGSSRKSFRRFTSRAAEASFTRLGRSLSPLPGMPARRSLAPPRLVPVPLRCRFSPTHPTLFCAAPAAPLPPRPLSLLTSLLRLHVCPCPCRCPSFHPVSPLASLRSVPPSRLYLPLRTRSCILNPPPSLWCSPPSVPRAALPPTHCLERNRRFAGSRSCSRSAEPTD